MIDLSEEQVRDLRRFGLQTPGMILDKAFRRGPITSEAMRKYQENVIKLSKGVQDELLWLMGLEVEGGECPQCGKPWNMVHVSNRFAEYMYFKPSCDCYGHCPRCRTSLHRETVGGIAPLCKSCGYDPRRPKSNRKKKGKKNRVAVVEEEADD